MFKQIVKMYIKEESERVAKVKEVITPAQIFNLKGKLRHDNNAVSFLNKLDSIYKKYAAGTETESRNKELTNALSSLENSNQKTFDKITANLHGGLKVTLKSYKPLSDEEKKKVDKKARNREPEKGALKVDLKDREKEKKAESKFKEMVGKEIPNDGDDENLTFDKYKAKAPTKTREIFQKIALERARKNKE